jgi:hypothetical protein
MLFMVVAMLVILVLAGAVVLYAAFPHRGEDVPHVPWVGELLRKGADRAPTLDASDEAQDDPASSSLFHDLVSLDHGRPEGRGRA